MTSAIDIQALRNYFLGLQENITQSMGELDGHEFVTDEWVKPEDARLKGDGRSRKIGRAHV